ncbi:MAG: hypothetical protein JWO60_959 [Frankiales bacterium]|nr:hypothetical protein [Frankiales bacterium]
MHVPSTPRRRLLAALTALPVAAALVGTAFGVGGTSAANSPQVHPAYAVAGPVTFPTNKQNEPTIARNPKTGRFVAGSNDEQRQPGCGPGPVRGSAAPASDCSFFPGVGTTPVYTSPDGSAWTNRGMLPGFSDPSGVGTAALAAGEKARTDLVSGGDPVLVYGPSYDPRTRTFSPRAYTAYYASLAAYAPDQQPGQQVPELLTVSRSADDGATWTAPVVAADGHGTLFNDKESLWADRDPRSPFFGRLYLSWTQFRGNGAEPINVATSADGGRTWSGPNQITPAYNNTQGGRQGSVVRSGPDGTVYVVWEDGVKGQAVQLLSVSRDGGRTFTRGTVIGEVSDLADPIYGSNFRTNSFPTFAVSPKRRGDGSYDLVVAWTNKTSATTAELVVATASSKALAWSVTTLDNTGYEFYPALDVAPDGRVDLGWQAQGAPKDATTYGTGNVSVRAYYASRRPGGTAFGRPVALGTPSDPAASAQNNLARQFWGDYNTLISDAEGAWLIYTDAGRGTGCPTVDEFQKGRADKPAPCSPAFGDTDVFVSSVAAP